MSLQVILKHSSVKDKLPTAAQLATGELSINLHDSGPFLSCKDTKGMVWRLGGVVFSAVAPPTAPGAMWCDRSTGNLLKIYDGTTWVAVGSTGTGGGTVTPVGDATTTSKGIVQLASAAAVAAGTAGLVVDSAQLKVVTDSIASAAAGGITGLTGTAPISVTGTPSAKVISINAATSTSAGVIRLATAAEAAAKTPGLAVDAAQAAAASATSTTDTPPASPTQGQQWWDTVSGRLFVWYEEPTGGSKQWVAATPEPQVPAVPDATTTSKGGVQLADGNALNSGLSGLVVDAAQLKAAAWQEAPNGAADGNVLYARRVITSGSVNVPSWAKVPETVMSDTPPVAPRQGQQWWDNLSGRLYIWYEEPSNGSKQWVAATPMPSPPLELWARNGGAISPASSGDKLVVTSINDGQLAGLRNVLINGSMKINQRGVLMSTAAVGQYGPDRWKRTAGGMTQTIEAGNFTPGEIYTLSGNGLVTQQLTAPATGNWALPDISSVAYDVQLELGNTATSFERRPIGLELTLCQRYFWKVVTAIELRGNAANAVADRYTVLTHPTTMRAAPAVTSNYGSLVNATGVTPIVTAQVVHLIMRSLAAGEMSAQYLADNTFSAEI